MRRGSEGNHPMLNDFETPPPPALQFEWSWVLSNQSLSHNMFEQHGGIVVIQASSCIGESLKKHPNPPPHKGKRLISGYPLGGQTTPAARGSHLETRFIDIHRGALANDF